MAYLNEVFGGQFLRNFILSDKPIRERIRLMTSNAAAKLRDDDFLDTELAGFAMLKSFLKNEADQEKNIPDIIDWLIKISIKYTNDE
jgi:hypothetical protein